MVFPLCDCVLGEGRDGAVSILIIALFLGPGTQLGPISRCGMDGWKHSVSLIPGNFFLVCALGCWVREGAEYVPSLFHCWGAVPSSCLIAGEGGSETSAVWLYFTIYLFIGHVVWLVGS